ncbi:MAG TPA: 23S rRNA (pseudouridine(1915)-N(3))-methyltransferase RlmH [Candidatus Eisenbacteria bacterium]|nr:23S rRNA (pseudouridine(1915)-N(3))-methyltransferase RlmH [Candidatus Eisenbacteria bacterium]
MQIRFRLFWARSGPAGSKAFKSPAAHALFSEYASRIGKFCPCEALGAGERPPASRLWLCDRGPGSKVLSSEELARTLGALLGGGARSLEIGIGGPDGFSKETLASLKPDLRWSFGPLTLPHELAAVVAAEQVYRAWAILRGLPYHAGH